MTSIHVDQTGEQVKEQTFIKFQTFYVTNLQI